MTLSLAFLGIFLIRKFVYPGPDLAYRQTVLASCAKIKMLDSKRASVSVGVYSHLKFSLSSQPLEGSKNKFV